MYFQRLTNSRLWRAGTFYALLALSFFSHSSFADCCLGVKQWNPLVTIGSGAAVVVNPRKFKNFPVVPLETNEFFRYSVQRRTVARPLFDIFLGNEWRGSDWAVQLGVEYILPISFSPRGKLKQGSDVQSQKKYDFRYHVQLQQLLFEGKLLCNYIGRYHPYLLLGLGSAFSQAKNFSVRAHSLPTRKFKDNSHITFSYSLGVGLDYDLTYCTRLGIGYRFIDFGRVFLGASRFNRKHVHGTLSQHHLYANQVLAQITVLY